MVICQTQTLLAANSSARKNQSQKELLNESPIRTDHIEPEEYWLQCDLFPVFGEQYVISTKIGKWLYDWKKVTVVHTCSLNANYLSLVTWTQLTWGLLGCLQGTSKHGIKWLQHSLFGELFDIEGCCESPWFYVQCLWEASAKKRAEKHSRM